MQIVEKPCHPARMFGLLIQATFTRITNNIVCNLDIASYTCLHPFIPIKAHRHITKIRPYNKQRFFTPVKMTIFF